MTENILDATSCGAVMTEQYAREFALTLAENAKKAKAEKKQYFVFIAMYGDLGVGKTAFVRGLASYLTPQAYVRSPTYMLVNEYESEEFRISHFDVYRIHDDDDLYSIGFYDYFPSETEYMIKNKQKPSIMAVEWCENIPFALPDEYYSIKIEKSSQDNPDERRLLIQKITK